MEHFNFTEAIRRRMTDEDVAFYRDIYAPTEVAVPDSDAWRSLCVMPDGEIRIYGRYGIKNVFQKTWQRTYIASTDGGLSWKRHFVKSPNALGASEYIPYLNLYATVCAREDGVYLLLGNDPDDEEPSEIRVCAEQYIDFRAPYVMKSRDRVLLVMHEHRPELHPTSFFTVVWYADNNLEEWHKVAIEPAPFYVPEPPRKGVRWQQNIRESTIEELSDGRLMMLSRTATDYHYVCMSEDGGASWTKPQPSVFHATGTMPCLKRLSDGRLLFAWCNTRLMPEREDADGIWEDVFTNRDANHLAISEDDGNSWIGFREVALNPLRDRADFRSFGGMTEERDKSVHQFEMLELPYNKLLFFYGQSAHIRRVVILDLKWIYEKSRTDDLLCGMKNISAQGYLDSVVGCYRGKPDDLTYAGHCAYNRASTAVMVPSPLDDGREAMQVAAVRDRRFISPIGGAVWNFPAAAAGKVSVSMMVRGEGLRLSLFDVWVNPTDPDAAKLAGFTTVIRRDSLPDDGRFHEVSLDFDCAAGCVSVGIDGKFHAKQKLTGKYPCGICYLHLQSVSDTDFDGGLVNRLSFQAK